MSNPTPSPEGYETLHKILESYRHTTWLDYMEGIQESHRIPDAVAHEAERRRVAAHIADIKAWAESCVPTEGHIVGTNYAIDQTLKNIQEAK